MSVSKRILRGVGANMFGQGVNMVTQVVGLPIFLAVWGVEKYGEWLVLSSLATFLTMSDVGFATAAANEMTMRVGSGDRNGALGVYQSMWAVLCGLGGLMLLVVAALLWLTPAAGWVPVTYTAAPTVASVLTILAAYVLVGQQVAVLQAGFRCDGAYPLGQSLSAGMRLVEFAAQAAAAAVTGSMVATAAAAFIARIASFAVIASVLSRRSPWLRHGVRLANRATVRALFAPAIAFMGMPLGHALANQGMIQIVAAFLSPAWVSVYTVHRTIANVAVQMMSVINAAVWPEVSAATGRKEDHLIRNLHRNVCGWTIWTSVFFCVFIVLVAPSFIPYWTAGKINLNWWLLTTFMGTVVTRSLWRSSSIILLATNRHAHLAATYVAINLVACLAATLLVPRNGVVGAAVAILGTDILLSIHVGRRTLTILDDSTMSFFRYVLTFPCQAPTNFRNTLFNAKNRT